MPSRGTTSCPLEGGTLLGLQLRIPMFEGVRGKRGMTVGLAVNGRELVWYVFV